MIREQEYYQLVQDRPDAFQQDDKLKIILDPDRIKKFEEDNPDKQIGIAYRSEYNMMVVDLVEDETGCEFCYERIMHTYDDPACVIVPMIGDQFVLIRQYRHAVRGFRYAFPRGFGEAGLDGISNSLKEVAEEIGGKAVKVRSLGYIEPDTGLTDVKVLASFCQLERYNEDVRTEGIDRIFLATPSELNGLIAKGNITDSMTIAAYMMFCLKAQLVK